jgi:hypothetical protein
MEQIVSRETPLALPPEPGSIPLRNPAHEIYARERALMLPPRLAAQKAGFAPSSTGQSGKLERSAKMQARIAYLTRQQEDILRAKRARLEQFWWMAIETDIAEYFEKAEEVVYDAEGNAAGTRTVQRLKFFENIEPEQRQLVEGLTFTEKGKPNLKLVSKSQANIELRKMLGGDAPAKTEVGHHDLTLEGLVMQAVALREQRMRDEQAKAADQITA